MKPLKVLTLGVFILPVIIIGASGGGASYPTRGGEVSWFSGPKATPNGWYWCYDDASDPPFSEPEMPPMLPPPYSNYSLQGKPLVSKLEPYNDEPYQYLLQDSFWYYGVWHEPGDHLYISPDGFISFDAVSEEGYPNPPTSSPPIPNSDDPNEIIAPLWQDNNPTRTPGDVSNNRVYYTYDSGTSQLIIEWYRIQGHTTGNEYTFLVMLSLGGQEKLTQYGTCGTIFSSHLIHFVYNTSSAGWAAEGGVTGIEDYTGQKGVYYQGNINTSGDNFHAVRMGYKKVFEHDVIPYAFLSPGSMVLRWTMIEPMLVVSNRGYETEHFPVALKIYDEGGDEVYNYSVNVYNLLPGMRDTISAPCWEPGEIDEKYTKVLYTNLDNDECRFNDTLEEASYVHCDDTFRYDWNTGGWLIAWGISDTFRVATFFASDGGAIVTGGRIPIHPYSPGPGGPWEAALWEAENGCGLPEEPPLVTIKPTIEPSAGYFYFESPVFVPASVPGNIWAGIIPGSATPVYPVCDASVSRVNSPCYLGDLGATAYWNNGNWYWPTDIQGTYPTLISELFVHLSFGGYPLSPKPQPPCYYDEPHDLTCYRMEEPNIDYVEDGVVITPELAIANIGRQAEPDMGFIPISFIAINTATGDEQFHDSALVNAIGWLGDNTDNPDTLYVGLPIWTPEGICAEENPIVDYELIGLVRLGEVGPDESDHCPYNDTVRRSVECLLSHDMGVTDITLDPGPDEPPDRYNPGTAITITATVENFGYHAENNVEVRCEITDKTADPDTLIWHNLQNITFLDWRGNDIDNPYTIDVVFPQWTTPSENRWIIECRTELEGDDCPDDDETVLYIPDAVKDIKPLPGSFALNTYSNVVRAGCNLTFAVPQSSWVRIEVFDAGGRWVRTLYNDASEPGYHDLDWNLTDQAGRKVGAGIYLIRMEADEFKEIKKVVILK